MDRNGAQATLGMVAIDLGFKGVFGAVLVRSADLNPGWRLPVLAVAALANLPWFALFVLGVASTLRPLYRARSPYSGGGPAEALRLGWAAPARVASLGALGWAGLFVSGLLGVERALPLALRSAPSPGTVALVSLGLAAAGAAVFYPLTEILLEPALRVAGRAASAGGHRAPTSHSPIGRRVGAVAALLATTSICALGALLMALHSGVTGGLRWLHPGVLPAVLLVHAGLVSVLVARAVSGPLRALREAVDGAVAPGLLAIPLRRDPLAPPAPEELGQIALGLNELMRQLDRASDDRADARRQRLDAERARESERTKTECLASVSHEVRTPLTAMLGFADLLLDPESSPEERAQYAERIQHNAGLLLAMVDDLRDLAHADGDRLVLSRAPCSLDGLLGELVGPFKARAAERGLGVGVTFRTLIPDHVHTDGARLRQILSTLLERALSATDAGGVQLVAALDDGPPARLYIDVVDTGRVGSRVDSHGMALARRLAQALGGSIHLSSNPGGGEIARLTLDPGPVAGVQRHRERSATAPLRQRVGVEPVEVPELCSEFGDDPFMAPMVRDFVDALRDRAVELRVAVMRGDREALRVQARQVKGAAGGYGFPTITDAADVVEQAVSRGAEWDRIVPAVEGLATLCQRARAA